MVAALHLLLMLLAAGWLTAVLCLPLVAFGGVMIVVPIVRTMLNDQLKLREWQVKSEAHVAQLRSQEQRGRHVEQLTRFVCRVSCFGAAAGLAAMLLACWSKLIRHRGWMR